MHRLGQLIFTELRLVSAVQLGFGGKRLSDECGRFLTQGMPGLVNVYGSFVCSVKQSYDREE